MHCAQLRSVDLKSWRCGKFLDKRNEKVGNGGLALALPLQQGSTYSFFPAIHADFADATVTWVQCTTLVQIVRMP